MSVLVVYGDAQPQDIQPIGIFSRGDIQVVYVVGEEDLWYASPNWDGLYFDLTGDTGFLRVIALMPAYLVAIFLGSLTVVAPTCVESRKSWNAALATLATKDLPTFEEVHVWQLATQARNTVLPFNNDGTIRIN
jgi:hypothetical protein